MFPEKRPASLRMALVTGLVDTRPFKLGRIRSAVRVMAVGASDLSFPERHMGGAHELGFSLQVALAADFYLCPLVKERCLVANLGELEAVGGLLHDRVAVGANNSTTGMRACKPIGLNSSLMALEAGVVLHAGGHG